MSAGPVHDRERLRVLVLSGCYLPGFRAGGPIRSLVNLVTALRPHVDFRIVTLDTDVGSTTPYPGVEPGVWQMVDDVPVLYLSREGVTVAGLAREIEAWPPDLLYLNGFFEPVFTVRLLWGRRLGRVPPVPILLAPRGDCAPGALQLKRFKKAVYVRLARLGRLYRGLTWQASSEMEAGDIMRLMHPPAGDVRVVPMLTDSVSFATPVTNRSGRLRVCFLSRIAPMKNLDFALRVLAEVTQPVDCSIFGPVEDEQYWARCRALIDRLPPHITATYKGAVEPRNVRATIAEHDLFFLPTRGENFGHVIFEALSAGVPVLTSDRTPWRDLEAHGAGWDLSLDDPEAFRRAIDAAAATDEDDRPAVAARVTAYAARRVDQPDAVRRTLELFRSVARS